MLVIGAVNVDLVVATARLPRPGQTVTGADLVRFPGGKGGNGATAAARLGARVAFVGAIGADDMGAEARSALAVEGIDLAGLGVTPRSTGVALIVVDANGENLIAVASGANGEVNWQRVESALARLAPGPRDVVLVSREVPADGVRAALEIGRDAGSITILNPAPADDLDAVTLELADILTPNETELALLGDGRAADTDPESAARRLVAGRAPGDAVSGGSIGPSGSGRPPGAARWERNAPPNGGRRHAGSGRCARRADRRSGTGGAGPGRGSDRYDRRRRHVQRGAGCGPGRRARPCRGRPEGSCGCVALDDAPRGAGRHADARRARGVPRRLVTGGASACRTGRARPSPVAETNRESKGPGEPGPSCEAVARCDVSAG